MNKFIKKPKYILTEIGKTYLTNQGKTIQALSLEANISTTVFGGDILKFKPFTYKTLLSLQAVQKALKEGIHYTKYNPNAVNCADCQKEMHDTHPHMCETETTIK